MSVIHLLAWKAAKQPIASPARIGRDDCQATRRTTSDRTAPSAIRTPISCVRCETQYAITLYSPTDAMSTARAPNSVNMVALNRQRCSCGATSSRYELTDTKGIIGESA